MSDFYAGGIWKEVKQILGKWGGGGGGVKMRELSDQIRPKKFGQSEWKDNAQMTG